MILRFPGRSILIQAVREGRVPKRTLIAPVWAYERPDGLWVRTDAMAPITASRTLRPLGIIIDPDVVFEQEPFADWFELEPLRPLPHEQQSQTPREAMIIGTDAALTRLSGELWRFGARSQSLSWLRDGQCLLRVACPPWHCLARCELPVFVPDCANIWIEFGTWHAFPERLPVPEGGVVLWSRSGRERIDLKSMPAAPRDTEVSIDGSSAPLNDLNGESVTIQLRLKATRLVRDASCWFLPGGREALSQLAKAVSEELLHRLDFLMLGYADEQITLMRPRSGHESPILIDPARPLSPVLRMDEVLIPSEVEVQPPLRRDVIRTALLHQTDTMTWIEPSPGGSAIRHRVPTASFQPLTLAIEYISENQRNPRSWWRPDPMFEFESFGGPDDAPRRRDRSRTREDTDAILEMPRGRFPFNVVNKSRQRQDGEATAPELAIVEAEDIDTCRRRLHELETRFLDGTTTLDSDEHTSSWPEMARLYFRLGNDRDGGVCWLNAFWNQTNQNRLLNAWHADEGHIDVQEVLTSPSPGVPELRRLGLALIRAASRIESAEECRALAGELTRFWEEHEERIPVKCAWLGWSSLAALTDGDVLMLTRARDRLLQRLHDFGPVAERDLPSFLLTAKRRRSSDHQFDTARINELAQQALVWSGKNRKCPATATYMQLMFAFGLARFGDADAARAILGEVGHPPRRSVPPAHRWLWLAYRERVQHELDGQRGNPAYSSGLVRTLDALSEPDRRVVDRMRQNSRILEPYDRIDPYRFQRDYRLDPFGRLMAELSRLTDSVDFALRAGEMLRGQLQGRQRFRLLTACLAHAFRAGESFAVEILSQVGPVQDERLKDFLDLVELQTWVHVLETCLALSAHYDRTTYLPELMERIMALLRAQSGPDRVGWLVGALSGSAFRTWSRISLREESVHLHNQMVELLTAGDTVSQAFKRSGMNRAAVYPGMLRLAGGWFYLGEPETALEVVDQVRDEILHGTMGHLQRTEFACAYASALGQASPEEALPRISELFEGLHVSSASGSGTPYNLNELRVVESVVLALVAEDFALDQDVKRRLDEEEHVIRRRIHRDVREAIAQAGLG